MPSRWAPSRRVVSNTWKSRSVGTRRSWSMGWTREYKKTPREREVCAQSGTDCALGDNDRAGGGHRGRVKHASPGGGAPARRNRGEDSARFLLLLCGDPALLDPG